MTMNSMDRQASASGGDESSSARASEFLRIERPVRPSSAADGSFGSHGLLEHLGRRLF